MRKIGYSDGGKLLDVKSLIFLFVGMMVVTAAFTSFTASADTTTQGDKPVFFEEDFEDGLSDWESDGLWHVVSEEEEYGYSSSGSKSAWYGQDSTGTYDTGSTTQGSLVSPSIDLSTKAEPELVFDHWYITENHEGNYDQVKVLVNGDQVYYRDTSDGNVGSEGDYVEESIDLSDYTDEEVQIEFVFDSVDDYNNDYRGWYIDDIAVKGYGTGFNTPPTADFSFSPTNPVVDETVQFTDESEDETNNIDTWEWEFGDGTTSTEQNPTHTYSSEGTYTVTLKVMDAPGKTDMKSKDITVQQSTEEGGSSDGKAVVFEEDFEGDLTGWETEGLWHITTESAEHGDVNSGSKAMWYGQQSVGTYDTGSHTVGTLTSPTIDLTYHSEPELNFHHWFLTENHEGNYDQIKVLVNGEQVYYRDTSDGNIGSEDNFVKETIDLSDYAGEEIQLEFVFDSIDDYDNDYRGWYLDDVSVKAYSTGFNLPPEAGFTYSPSEPTIGETVQFSDDSSDTNDNIVEWHWEFGDGTTSDQQNPTHTYDSEGTYDVTLTVVDAGDSTDTYTTTVPVNEEDTNSGEGYQGANMDSFQADGGLSFNIYLALALVGAISAVAVGYKIKRR